MPPERLEITSHCLLRLVTTLMLEAADIPHGQPCASEELNHRTARQHSSREWLAILEPHYRRRFMPGDDRRPLA